MTNEIFAALLPMCDEMHPIFSLFFHCLGREFYKLNLWRALLLPLTLKDMNQFCLIFLLFLVSRGNSW